MSHRNTSPDYFLMGAQQGHVLCMQELSLLYQEPECKDYIAAFKWAEKAAQSGDLLCEFILGVLYYEGKGCACDIEKAKTHLRHAADHGIYEAQDFLKMLEVPSTTTDGAECRGHSFSAGRAGRRGQPGK